MNDRFALELQFPSDSFINCTLEVRCVPKRIRLNRYTGTTEDWHGSHFRFSQGVCSKSTFETLEEVTVSCTLAGIGMHLPNSPCNNFDSESNFGKE